MGEIWRNPNSANPKTFHKMFEQRLNDQYQQNWFSTIRSSHRFDTLHIVKNDYKFSNYLKYGNDIETRKIITRLRENQNKLSVCVGRQKNEPLENRICPICNDHTETVKHFLLRCTGFHAERNHLFNVLDESMTQKVRTMHEDMKLCLILNLENPHTGEELNTINAICKYVKQIYTKRLDMSINIV